MNERKQNAEATYGNINVANDDLVTVNACGRVISIKRSILTQQVGTRFEAIFSGRWDKKLLRDSDDTIFLDVNPDSFQAIVNYFGERMISSANDPPSPPTVEDELDHILQNQLELFGLVAKVGKDERHFKILHDSDIIEVEGLAKILHNWLKEDDSDGEFTLLYRRSRDGLSKKAIRSKCDGKALPSPSLKRLMVKSWGGIPTRPGQAVMNIVRVRPTKPVGLHSLAAAFRLPAK